MIKPRNLLIVRTDRIGDVILSLPLVPVIKERYPDCRITFLMRDYTRALTEGNPYIDEVLLLKIKEDKVSLIENIREIYSKNFDTAIIVYPTFLISFILFFSGIKHRIGTGYRWYSFLFNKKIYEHRKYAEKHELEYNFSLLSLIGINNTSKEEKSRFLIKPDAGISAGVTKLLEQKGVDLSRRILIIHPGSGGSSVDLPIERYRELIKLIASGTDSEIIITGSSSEKEKCEGLADGSRAKNLSGCFNLAELVSLIDLSVIFISNSTGPLHIAAALGKYVIGFYPKVQECSAKRWGPYTEKGYVYTPEIECIDCTVEQCHKLNCMNSININLVFEKIEKILTLVPDTGETDAK
jgi:heptosyltransferase III